MQLFLILFFSFSLAQAYQSSLTNNNKKIYWLSQNIPISIQSSTSDFSSATSQALILNSIAEWNSVSPVTLIPTASSLNTINFAQNFPYGNAVVGMTQVNYNSQGVIQNASILLNDSFTFRTSAGVYASNQIFLSDVVTHELGHFLGLAHSEVLNSSMFYSSFSGQSTVSADDIGGVRAKYSSAYGSITGYVKGGHKIGVLGAHVQAISRKTGEVVSAVTDEKGYFSIGGLTVEDTFYLYTSPIKNLQSLPGYFSNVQKEFCPAAYVGSFYTACGHEEEGLPQGINITAASRTVDVGTVTINCSLKAQEDYSYQKVQSTFSPLMIWNYGTEAKFEKAYVGYFRKPTGTGWLTSDFLQIDLRDYLDVVSTPKYVKFQLIAQPLGNQLEYEMSVTKNSVLMGVQNITTVPLQGTYDIDLESTQYLDPAVGTNLFELEIKAKKLTANMAALTFPSYDTFSTLDNLPYLLIVSILENGPNGLGPIVDTASNLSDNTSCLDAPFTYAVSQANALSDSSKGAEGMSPLSCGTTDDQDPKDPPNSSLSMLLGLCLISVAANLVKRTKKFLS